MVKKGKWIERAREIYWNRSRVGRELKASGAIIVGYVCCYVPVEVISALGMIPFKVFSSMRERVTESDKYIPRQFCPIIRSMLAQSLGSAYDFP